MSTRDHLESTVVDSHIRLQLSESSIHSNHHTQSGEHLNCFNVIFHCDLFWKYEMALNTVRILFYQSISFNIFITIIAIHWYVHHVLHQYVLIKIAYYKWCPWIIDLSSYLSSAEMSSRDVLDGLEVDRSGSIQDAWCSLLMCFLNISHVLETASREMSSYLSSAELSSRGINEFEVTANETLRTLGN